MQIKKILDLLEEIAPYSLQENYDNSRLITGSADKEISGALLALDCTEEIIDEAIELGYNLVIAHHPIVFSGLKKFTGSTYIERVLIKAIKNDISILACHTNLDNVFDGVNKKIADKIGLKNCKVLLQKTSLLKKLVTYCPLSHIEQVRNGFFAVGAGKIGNYDCCSFGVEGTGTFKGNEFSNPFAGEKNAIHFEKEIRLEVLFESHKETKVLEALRKNHPYEEIAYEVYGTENLHPMIGSGLVGELEEEENEILFLRRVKQIFNANCLRYTHTTGQKIRKVALCGGSGSFLLPHAISSGAQVFISSDFKYHQFFDADNKIVIADIGHYETEQFTGEIFYDVIREKFPKFAVRLTKKNTNPVNYL